MSHRKRMMEDLDQDIRDHIEMETQDNIERGMPAEEARYAALRKFGSVTRAKEQTREVWSFMWLEHLLRDIIFAFRGLFRNKVFATSAILTIGLGIGSSVVMFTVFSAVLLRPLPYSDPDRLVVIWETKQQLKADRVTVAARNFEDWREQNHVFEGMTLVEGGLYHLARRTGTVNITALRTDGDFFHVLGMSAHVGRTLNMEDVRSKSDVLVLSDALWKKEFGGNVDIIGQTTRLDNVTYTIAGVLPPDFYFPVAKHWDAVVPLRTNAQEQGDRQAHTYGVVARLRKHVSLGQAQAEMDTITRGLAVKYGVNPNVGSTPYCECMATQGSV